MELFRINIITCIAYYGRTSGLLSGESSEDDVGPAVVESAGVSVC